MATKVPMTPNGNKTKSFNWTKSNKLNTCGFGFICNMGLFDSHNRKYGGCGGAHCELTNIVLSFDLTMQWEEDLNYFTFMKYFSFMIGLENGMTPIFGMTFWSDNINLLKENILNLWSQLKYLTFYHISEDKWIYFNQTNSTGKSRSKKDVGHS